MAEDYTAKELLALAGISFAGTEAIGSAKKTTSALVNEALGILNTGGITTYQQADVEAVVAMVLSFVDRKAPYVKKDTSNVVTVADTKEIDLSGISGKIWPFRAEWVVDQTPPKYRNIKPDYGSIWILEVDIAPTEDDEEVYIWYTSKHILTNTPSDNTLDPDQEQCVVLGLVAYSSYTRNSSPVYDMEMARSFANDQTYGRDPAGVHLSVARLIQKTDPKTYSMMILFENSLEEIANYPRIIGFDTE